MHLPHKAQFSGVLIRAYFLRFFTSREKSFSGHAEMQRPQPLHLSGAVITGGLERGVSVSCPIAAAPAVSICFEGQGGVENTAGMRL